MIENEILLCAVILLGVMMKSIPNEGVKVCCHCDACIESPGLGVSSPLTNLQMTKTQIPTSADKKSLRHGFLFFDDKTQNSA